MKPALLWLKLRAWWYLRRNSESLPPDVREYIIRRDLKTVLEGAKTAEEKHKLSLELMTGAFGLETQEISPEVRDELTRAAFKLLDDVPLTRCASCDCAVFVHEAVKVDDKLYCAQCANRSS
jgi:formylmethanofuran dehydrogenase subunit E